MKFYSWKDVERLFLERQDSWKNVISYVETYPDVVSIHLKDGKSNESDDVLKELFPKNYEKTTKSIKLDIGDNSLSVIEEESDEYHFRPSIPLFREELYRRSINQENLPSLECPVIAFHSYKGGVGRTLSLLAFAKAWTNVFEGKSNGKLLIIDSDIEAPGMTWIQDSLPEDTFSYLDLLSLIQDNEMIERTVELTLPKIVSSTITIESNKSKIDHYFLPTYRYINQLLDLYAKPDTIVNGKNKEYALAEILSKIGSRLGVGAVLVDLRAGVSELSAPILLDPRVRKYIVTSTSKQSISGTKIILNFLTKGLTIKEDTLLPNIIINMIPDNMSSEEKTEMYSFLLNDISIQEEDADSLFDNIVTELPFASELIHTTSMDQILNNLNDRDMYIRIKQLVAQNYEKIEHTIQNGNLHIADRDAILAQIRNIASEQIAAEGNSKFDLMMTAPLRNLGKQFANGMPTTIIMGAKGSGKTFLFGKMIEACDWNSFFSKLDFSQVNDKNAFFFPLLATKNSINMTSSLKACINRINSSIHSADISEEIYLMNGTTINNRRSISDWRSYWERLITTSFNPNCFSFAEMEDKLKKENKKIVFVIDGLEEWFQDTSKSISEKDAIASLCQEIVPWIRSTCTYIGIIVFLRRDLAQNAIRVNFEQFRKSYEKTELKWSSNEALRLAVWLVKQADENFYKEEVDISSASQSVIDQHLIDLWGLKLGKPSSNEAYSSRWILAALSDFNGQLQARDIIRFLEYASVDSSKKPSYDDRLLMPADIKKAVQDCSTDKMKEIKEEYKSLSPIFKKLETLPESKKTLPLRLTDAELTSFEEASLTQEGYLKRDGEAYYFPEIVRHALGFKYEKGARPKVLSLTLKSGNV